MSTMVEDADDEVEAQGLPVEVESNPGDDSRSSKPDPIPLWKKLTAAGAFLLAVGSLYLVIANNAGSTSRVETAGQPLIPTSQPVDIPADTLGIRFDELRDMWNSVEREPLITRQLTRTPESGPLDSFFYHFPYADLIGAYNDGDDYVTALMVRTSLDNPDIDTIYLHLCQIVSPYSPECIDNYFSIGLSGLTPGEFAETGQESVWTHQGNEWRLAMVEDDLTIRVLAPDAD